MKSDPAAPGMAPHMWTQSVQRLRAFDSASLWKSSLWKGEPSYRSLCRAWSGTLWLLEKQECQGWRSRLLSQTALR